MQKLLHRLSHLYDRDEARALLRIAVEDICHCTWTRFVCDGTAAMDAEATRRLEDAVKRMADGEPIQHITGRAVFCGREFRVTGDTLVPRPETEDLVHWIALADGAESSLYNTDVNKSNADEHDYNADVNIYNAVVHSSVSDGATALRVLDIGTGTGCIAVSLALALPRAEVTALDISPEALAVAEENWARLGAGEGQSVGRCRFLQHDILSPTPPALPPQDIIVSNPPYICDKERGSMHVNVLDHDPHLALFVPDDNPLLFYRSISRHAKSLLADGGRLYFEANSLYAAATAQLLRDEGYGDVETRRDRYGRPRMVRAVWKRRAG